MLLVLVAAPLAWIALAFGLSALMARRGYDRVAWLVISVLFGPIALILVLMELALAVPRRAEVLQQGRPGEGETDILVVCGKENLPPDAGHVLDKIAPSRRRLVLARVLPPDGARAAEWAAETELRACASTLGTPQAELVLLFGVPRDSVTGYAITENLNTVLVATCIPRLSESLAARGIQACDMAETNVRNVAEAP